MMGSSSGTSSGSGSGSSSVLMRNSGCEEDLVDERKRKRKISNRESARRSRMRKQKHVDDLTAQAAQLMEENHRILSSITITTEHYLNLEAENAVMQAQATELTQRLESLNEIIGLLGFHDDGPAPAPAVADSFMNPPPLHLHMACLSQPIMASADIFHHRRN